ncbi:MAG: NADH-quinone oxidoreductase subunit N [Planctomycetes bacterium]|nr:NADH-quinone oxidoreductase subunit N [Planctomycetota bacterium]
MPEATAPAISIGSLLPELILLIAGCAALLLGQAARESLRQAPPWVALAGIVAAILVLVFQVVDVAAGTFGGLALGTMAHFVRLSALTLAVALTLVGWSQPPVGERGEFFAMMLLSLTGLMLAGSADDLVMLFMALELVSIPTYVLVVLGRRGSAALEAGTKYFYLGAMSAAVTAYGFSFLYGVAGTAALPGAVAAVTAALAQPGTTAYAAATIGVVLSLGGLFFKIAAVPLHFYIADVYQGAASPVAGFLGFVPKLAGLVAIFRIVDVAGWRTYEGGLFWLLWLIAILSMTIGNVLALRQTNIKRMLAYSGIAHSGYMLVGVLAGYNAGNGIVGDGVAACCYYVVIYGLANLGAFAILGLLQVRGRDCETLRDIAGLLRSHPGLALLMTLAMFTLMGLPPTPGFWGKLSLFGSALAAAQTTPGPHAHWLIALVVIAVLNSALAAAYYLRVIAACLLYENPEPAEAAPREAQHVGALLCGFLLLFFMFCPSVLMGRGRDATSGFRAASLVATDPAPAAPSAAQLATVQPVPAHIEHTDE